MIRRIILLAIIFILGFTTPALAAEIGTGKIEGRIINETDGGSSVAGQEITLVVDLNDAEVSTAETEADGEGKFSFDGLSVESGYGYQVKLNYQSADYYSEWLAFAEGKTTRFAEVIVYDSTTSDEAVKVAMAHTIIYVGEGSLEVKEYLVFVNESDRTYIGPAEDGQGGTLRLHLPDGATELQLGLGLMECCVNINEEGFTEKMPLTPGSREVAYSYRVAYDSGAYTFYQKTNYPLTKLDVLIQGDGIEVVDGELTTGEPLDIGGIIFNHLTGQDLNRGDILVIQLSELPQVNKLGNVIWWTVLTLVVLVGGLIAVYVIRKKRPIPVSPKVSSESRIQKLLIELAGLDDSFEAGTISEEDYHQRRDDKKAQLVELMQKSRE